MLQLQIEQVLLQKLSWLLRWTCLRGEICARKKQQLVE